MIRVDVVLALLLGAWLWSQPVSAQVPASQELPFSSLSAQEQEYLAALAPQWPSLSAEAKANLRAGARRWHAMTPEQRQQAAERFARWQALSDAERAKARENWQRFRAMPEAQRRRLERTFQYFQSLPEHERAALRQRFAQMSPQERRAFMEGATGAARAGQARTWRKEMQQWLQGLDAEEQRALRLALKDKSRPERFALLQELRQLSPQQRRARLLGQQN